jgi:SAM-dependent methyltransferase
LNKQGDWWESFFSGMCLDFVQSSRSEEQTRSEMGFIQRALGLPTRAKVLDVPCGGGRLSLELASFGYQVTGIDQSPQLLDAAARSATERGLLVDWQQRDMRDLPWDAKFDGAICFWSSFGYFDEEGNAEFLRSVSRSLKPGARFIFDTQLIETRLAEVLDEPRVWQEVGDLLALEERGFDYETSRVESSWTFIRDGEREHRQLSMRLYTYRELAALLEHAGFGNHQAYGSVDFEPFEPGDRWLYLVTTRADT